MPIFLSTLDGDIEVAQHKFPGGELRIKLPVPIVDLNHITAVIKSSDDLITLGLTVDALKRNHAWPRHPSLVIPYIPYARQDRVCDVGESHSLKFVADYINRLGFKQIEAWDTHSSVCEAVFDNLCNFPAEEVITPIGAPNPMESYFKRYREKLVIVAPDAGAEKRARSFAKHFQIERVITCSKNRNPRTGEINGVTVHPEAGLGYVDPYARYLIVDDICDGGRTFIEVGKEIADIIHFNHHAESHRVDGTVDLFVTHGIFSKGIDALSPYINTVFTTNSLLLRADLPPDALLKGVCGTVSEVGLEVCA